MARQLVPGATAAAGAVAADWLALHSAAVVCLVLAAVLLPVARMASTRLMLAALGGLTLGSMLHLLGVRVDRAWVTPLVASLMVLAGGIAARRRRGSKPWPRVDLGDGLVLLAGLVLFVMLAIPFRGIGPEGILLDLGRGFDNLMHLSMFMDAVAGTSSPATSGYPRGFHVLLLLVGGGSLNGLPAESVVPAFAMLSVALTAAAGVVCGWTAVGVAGVLADGRHGHMARAVAGLMYAVFVVVGGLFSGMYEVGHVAFLVTTAVLVGSSWLAIRPGSPNSVSIVVLGAASVAALGSYPPLVVGLLPAVLWFLRSPTRRGGSTPWLASVGVLVLLVAATVGNLRPWLGRLTVLATDTGEVSTPVASVLLYLVLGLGIAWAATRSGLSLPVGAWGPVAGFGSLGAGFAVLAVVGGTSVVASYYTEKSLQAAWVAGSVFVFGAAAALATGPWVSARRPSAVRASAVAGALALLLGGILLVPDGRYWLVEGVVPSVEMAKRRMAEAEAANGRLHVLATAKALGTDPEEVVILADPEGWLLPFVTDDGTRYLATATWAVNLVRGPLTTQAAIVALCLEENPSGNAFVACARGPLGKDPRARVTIVVEDPAEAARLQQRVGGDGHSISVVRMEEILS